MKKRFSMVDLDCANCAAKMETAIKKIDGVHDATVRFLSQKLTIEAFEKDIQLKGNVYTIYVKQDDEEGVVDVFMETKA